MGDWYSADDVRRLAAAGICERPPWLRMETSYARRRVFAARNRETVLRIIAALDQWRTMMVQQVEALTDTTGIAGGYTSLVSALWNHGLIELCATHAAFTRTVNRQTLLLRPAQSSEALQTFSETISAEEWLTVTAGLPLDGDRQYARHNTLATEFGLRLAEHAKVGMALGEKLSSMALLAYAATGAAAPPRTHNSADLTVVRADGLRIAVEMTANLGPRLRSKVEHLVRVLDDRALAQTGLTVLFVVAPRQDGATTSAAMSRAVKWEVQQAVHRFRGSHLAPTHSRVAVTRWEDLFPAPGMVVDDFARLPAERPTGPGFLGEREAPGVWQREHLLDPEALPFSPEDSSAMLRVIRNGRSLRGVPHALRADAVHRRTQRHPSPAQIGPKGNLSAVLPQLVY